jgi:hypothetical protein
MFPILLKPNNLGFLKFFKNKISLDKRNKREGDYVEKW